jgi:hypothetical protein
VDDITVRFGEQVIAGGALTRTVKLHEAVAPERVAVQLTVVVPGPKIVPDAGVQDAVAFAGVMVGAG